MTMPSPLEIRSVAPAGALGAINTVSGAESLTELGGGITGPGGIMTSADSLRARSLLGLGNSVMAPARPAMIPNATAASSARTSCRSWPEGQWQPSSGSNSYAGGFNFWWNNIAASSVANLGLPPPDEFWPLGPDPRQTQHSSASPNWSRKAECTKRRAASCRPLQIGLGQLLASALRPPNHTD